MVAAPGTLDEDSLADAYYRLRIPLQQWGYGHFDLPFAPLRAQLISEKEGGRLLLGVEVDRNTVVRDHADYLIGIPFQRFSDVNRGQA